MDPMTRSEVPRRRGWVLVGAATALAMLVGCTPESESENPTATGPASTDEPAATSALGNPEVHATGLEAPWSIAFLDDTALVSERDSGRILELDSEGAPREVGRIADAAATGEAGLLGIAVADEALFAYYSTDEDNRIERFALDGDPGALSLGDGDVILEGLPTASFHSGGRIAFGPDGMIYATVGDAGDRESAQDENALSGKILRMTPEGDVPEGNPFDRSLVYSYGHRNPQGLAWDEDGTMYASEFGQDTWDELNIIEAGSNYGWPVIEGITEDGDGGQGGDEFVDPVQQWTPDEASPSGMSIVGDSIYVANLRGERLREIPLSDTSTSTEHFVGEFGRLRDVVEAPDGSLWMLTNNTDGRGDPGEDDDRVLRLEE